MNDEIFAEVYISPNTSTSLTTEEVLVGQHVGLLENYHIVVGNVFLRFSKNNLKRLVDELNRYVDDIDESERLIDDLAF